MNVVVGHPSQSNLPPQDRTIKAKGSFGTSRFKKNLHLLKRVRNVSAFLSLSVIFSPFSSTAVSLSNVSIIVSSSSTFSMRSIGVANEKTLSSSCSSSASSLK